MRVKAVGIRSSNVQVEVFYSASRPLRSVGRQVDATWLLPAAGQIPMVFSSRTAKGACLPKGRGLSCHGVGDTARWVRQERSGQQHQQHHNQGLIGQTKKQLASVNAHGALSPLSLGGQKSLLFPLPYYRPGLLWSSTLPRLCLHQNPTVLAQQKCSSRGQTPLQRNKS
jgi:hypothetical protein